MPGVALAPFPGPVVPRRGLIELLPQRQVLDLPAFALPAPCFPGVDPLAHAPDDVRRIGHVRDRRAVPLAGPPTQDGAYAPPRHGVGGSGGRAPRRNPA